MEDHAAYEIQAETVTIRESALEPFDSPTYTKPTWQEVRALLRKHNLTGSKVGALTGVNPRAVRKWQAPPDASSHTEIPYSAWRLLLLLTREIAFNGHQAD